jgi:alkanesulfonate monooxygenase SsuD/methylene tetrahydromethanopterin reductase-like flavin-dependent oxidoreductase (luciferase family)
MAISLDQISGGRLDLAMGTGSFPEEMAQFGIAFADARTRTRQLDEALRVIKLICTQSRSSFDGEFYQLRDAPNAPAPIQKPHPPITIGGGGEKLTLPLVARHADIWNCPTYSLSEQARKIGVLRTECERIGRDPATLRMSEETVLVLARSPGELATALEEAQRRYAGAAWGLEAAIAGTPVEVIEQIRRKITLGIDYFIFFFHDRGRPETLELFASEVMPAFA